MNIKTKILDEIEEGTLLIVEVDTGRMMSSKAEQYMKNLAKKFRELDLPCKFLVVHKNIQLSKILVADKGETARRIDIGMDAMDFANL